MDPAQSSQLTSATRRNAVFLVGVSLAVLLYLFLAARHLYTPGLQADEALQALPAIHLASGTMNGQYAPIWYQRIGWRHIPLMNMEYMGALKSWAFVLLFKIFGIKVLVMRSFTVALAALGLLFLAAFARRCWGNWVALFSLCLLATDVNFILATRTDWGPVTIAFFFRAVTAWALVRWWQSGGNAYWLWLACGAMGLGLFDKTNFLWFILALLPVILMIVWRLQRKPTWREISIAVGVGLTTSLPLWVYNLATGMRTFRMVALPGQSVGLTSFLEAMPARTSALLGMFDGHGIDSFWFGQTVTHAVFGARSWLAALSALAFLGLPVLALLRRRWELLMLPFLALAMLVQIYVTPRPVWLHHWIGVYPLPHLAIALFFKTLGETWRKPSISQWIGSLVMAVAVLVNLGLMHSYHQLMAQQGGVGVWSDQIYALADRLQRDYADRPLQVLDWGISNPLTLLTAGKLQVNEPFWLCEQQPRLLALMRDQRNLFVLHAASQTNFPQCRPTFFQVAQSSGIRLQMVQAIYERNGKELFELWEAAPQ